MRFGNNPRVSLPALVIAAIILTPAGTAWAEGGLGGLDPVVEAGDQVVTGTVDTVDTTVDKTVDKTVDAADKTVDTVETVVAEVEETADDVQERTERTADTAETTVTEVADATSDPSVSPESEPSEASATEGSSAAAAGSAVGAGTEKGRPDRDKEKGRTQKAKRDGQSRSRATENKPVIAQPDPAGPMVGPGVYQPIAYEEPTRARRPTASGFDLGLLPFTGYAAILALLVSGVAISIGLILILTGRWRRAPRLPTGLWTEAPSAATGTLR